MCLLPPLVWYGHARSIWLEYGNSLGISNEALVYIWSLGFLRALPAVVLGVLYSEAAYARTPPGLLFALPSVPSLWRPTAPSTSEAASESASRGAQGISQPLLLEWAFALADFLQGRDGTQALDLAQRRRAAAKLDEFVHLLSTSPEFQVC